VKWDWLSGHAALLFGFIMLVLAVPTTIADNWQLIRSAIRRLRRPKPASVVSAPKDETEARPTPAPAWPIFTDHPEYPPPGYPDDCDYPDYRLAARRAAYGYNGGAVSTAAAMDAGSYTPWVLKPASTVDVLPLFTLTMPSVNGRGTAFTP
jgi:hypothetical protein